MEEMKALTNGILFAPLIIPMMVFVSAAFSTIVMISLLSIAALSFLCRILAVAVTAVSNPIVTLSAIPVNWRKAIFLDSLFAPLDLVPGFRRLQYARSHMAKSRTQVLDFLNISPSALLKQLLHAPSFLLPLIGISILLFVADFLVTMNVSTDGVIRATSTDFNPTESLRLNRTVNEQKFLDHPRTEAPQMYPLHDPVSADHHVRQYENPFGKPRESKVEIYGEPNNASINMGYSSFLRLMSGSECRISLFDYSNYFEFWRSGVMYSFYVKGKTRGIVEWMNDHSGFSSDKGILSVFPGFFSYVAICACLLVFHGFICAYIVGLTCLFLLLANGPPRMLFFIPAISYRISLKAISVIYWPLIWICESPVTPVKDQDREVIGQYDHPLAVISRALSLIAIGYFVIKISIRMFRQSLSESLSAWIHRFFPEAVMRGDAMDAMASCRVYPWEVASFLGGLLSMLLWYYVSCIAWRRRHGIPYDIEVAAKTTRTMARARSVIAAYSAICVSYSVYHISGHVPIPTLELMVFPWSI